jgi:tRNA nucleotidyltransferase/poly(A) polymerase
MKKIAVPEEVILVSKTLAEAGFEAYLVGGCVRDMLLGREPKDWDVATDAIRD